MAIWNFEPLEGTRYITYIKTSGNIKHSLKLLRSNYTGEKYEQMIEDICEYIHAKHNKAMKYEIIEHFKDKYPEHEIDSCMTPLLIAGKLEEHIVYSVV